MKEKKFNASQIGVLCKYAVELYATLADDVGLEESTCACCRTKRELLKKINAEMQGVAHG